MGNEQSGLVGGHVPPETLAERSLAAVAELIKEGRARQIVVLTGAGVSTAAGIPDFRSPKTGLYANLQRLNLPFAEAVFDISYFRQKPEPFYVLAKELYPGKFHPTVAHSFIYLLAKKGLLRMLFTQNIDCLERRAGVPEHLIVEAHGSFATQRCIECSTEYPDEKMKEHIMQGDVPRCDTCNGLVKPDIVFFGEQLPKRFHDYRSIPATADLCLILGTSLSVQPFASLPSIVQEGTPRVLFNLERVGGIGSRADDVLALEDCDSGIRQLADELGWRDELEEEWRAIVGDEEADRQLATAAQRSEVIDDEVTKLADEVEDVLRLDRLTDTDGRPWDSDADRQLRDSSEDSMTRDQQQRMMEQIIRDALLRSRPDEYSSSEPKNLEEQQASDEPGSERDSLPTPNSESESNLRGSSTMPPAQPQHEAQTASKNGSADSGSPPSSSEQRQQTQNDSDVLESKKLESESLLETEKKPLASTAEADTSPGAPQVSGHGSTEGVIRDSEQSLATRSEAGRGKAREGGLQEDEEVKSSL